MLFMSEVTFTDQNFSTEVLQSQEPVLVDFWAPWCGPCRIVGPIVKEIAQEFAGKVKVGKLNVDENSATAQKYGVMSIPTLAIFKNGEVADQLIGAHPKEAIAEHLEKVL